MYLEHFAPLPHSSGWKDAKTAWGVKPVPWNCGEEESGSQRVFSGVNTTVLPDLLLVEPEDAEPRIWRNHRCRGTTTAENEQQVIFRFSTARKVRDPNPLPVQGTGNRTKYLMHAQHALSQLSYAEFSFSTQHLERKHKPDHITAMLKTLQSFPLKSSLGYNPIVNKKN